jgi:hypothetical protein
LGLSRYRYSADAELEQLKVFVGDGVNLTLELLDVGIGVFKLPFQVFDLASLRLMRVCYPCEPFEPVFLSGLPLLQPLPA